jgi:hypothetical protein
VLKVNPLPSTFSVVDLSVCKGAKLISLLLAIKNNSNGAEVVPVFSKDGQVVGKDFNPELLNVGSYVFSVKLVNNVTKCEATPQQFKLTVTAPPICKITSDKTGCRGDEVNFTASGGSTYSWTGPNDFSATTATISRLTCPGEYWVTVTNASGCSSKCSVIIPKPKGYDWPDRDNDFTCSPNPFNGYINIKCNFDFRCDVKIELFDSVGKLLLTRFERDCFNGKEFNLDLNQNREGVYIIKMTNSLGTCTKRIIASR